MIRRLIVLGLLIVAPAVACTPHVPSSVGPVACASTDDPRYVPCDTVSR